MTSFIQFCNKAKMRHDFSDQIQVRYGHPNGENFDAWISGDEVLARLKTMSREHLIQSFSRMGWQEAKTAVSRELQSGKKKARHSLKNRLANLIEKQVGGNIFSNTFADNIRGIDSNKNPDEHEKQRWQAYLQQDAFRAIALELAWTNLEGTFPSEPAAEPNDWV